MSSALFRQLASGGEARNSDGMFRAAIAAFASLTRPSRREITQLDDLALPLFSSVPVETRRYAAAVLCECPDVPPRLLHRLCDEPIEISAPLLVRSTSLSDVDLIGLIAKHGLPHARLIGRRPKLNPAIAALIRAMIAQSEDGTASGGPAASGRPSPMEKKVRARLRAMMRKAGTFPDETSEDLPQPFSYEDLRRLALDRKGNRFEAELARHLKIPDDRARQITGAASYGDLLTALRALDLTEEEAFLLTIAEFPAEFSGRAAIRLFIERYQATSSAEARERVRQWRDSGPAYEPILPQPAAIGK